MSDALGGRLLVVATPIGNLGDLSGRAAEALTAADAIYCEDTRHTGRLLASLPAADGRRPVLRSLHQHNEVGRIAEVLARLRAGETVALASDAGTPCLSDPGALLVDAVHDAGGRVETIPGPFAAAAGLAASGLRPMPMVFHGFPPKKRAARLAWFRARLVAVADAPQTTHACYVAGRDLIRTCEELAEVVPAARVVVARELTKLHEAYVRGTAADLVDAIEPGQLRGEAVVLVEVGASPTDAEAERVDVAGAIVEAAATDGDRKVLFKELAARSGQPRKRLYAAWTAARRALEDD